ncbi:SSI family serine proteinase inhibitor [Streptomyces sp. NPDC058045]|uniref:SSI family serine proteinase inhibitor n=1 Tax=Streptomyces sp. NPDC058045 TaxID=3346311 RepID=UPI0036F122CC
MLRRFAVTAAVSLAALSVLPASAQAEPGPAGLPDLSSLLAPRDRLTVSVTGAGGDVDGTYELSCRPAAGSHPNPAEACRQLGEYQVRGADPFAPVSAGTMCTMVYGGPATAHVTGTWGGRRVDTEFRRTDGCEVRRWDALVPVLPAVGRG